MDANAAREEARRHDGTFGPLARGEAADVSLGAAPDLASPTRRISDAMIRIDGFDGRAKISSLDDIDWTQPQEAIDRDIALIGSGNRHIAATRACDERAEYAIDAIARGGARDRLVLAAGLHAFDTLDGEFCYVRDEIQERYLAYADVALRESGDT